MAEQDSWLIELRKKQEKEKAERLTKAKKHAVEIGKEPFSLETLEKYWHYRFKDKLTSEEYLEDMKKYEEEYYLAGERHMTMADYGKHLMKMELYR